MTNKAEHILNIVESATDEIGLLDEEMDPRSNQFLGNTPLIFSLVEHIRALIELNKAKPLSKAALMMGQIKGATDHSSWINAIRGQEASIAQSQSHRRGSAHASAAAFAAAPARPILPQ